MATTPTLVDSDTASGTGSSISGTIDVSGANRLAIVMVSLLNSGGSLTVASVTFGSDGLAELGSIEVTDDSRVEIWYLKQPTTGTGITVTITFDSTVPDGASAWIGSFSGVDQTTPLGSYASASLDGADPKELVVTAVTNDYTIGGYAGEYGVAVTITSGNPATELFTYNNGNAHHAFARYTSTAGNFTYQWDGGGSGQHTAMNAVAIKGLSVSYKLEGITYDKAGDALGSVECYLFKDNGDNTLTYVDYILSNVSTGAFSFTGIGDNDAAYLVVGWKDDTPHVFDVSDHVLQPVIE